MAKKKTDAGETVNSKAAALAAARTENITRAIESMAQAPADAVVIVHSKTFGQSAVRVPVGAMRAALTAAMDAERADVA